MIICVFDSETTHLEVKKARVVEVAVALIDCDLKHVIEQWSTLIYGSEYGRLDNPEFIGAFDINKISKTILTKYGMPPKDAFKILNRYFEKSDYVIAHNGNNFDKPILEFEMAQFGITLSDKPWIDSREDVEWADSFYSKRLIHLAADLEIYCGNSHRALDDVKTLVEILKRANVNFTNCVERIKSPLIEIVANCTYATRDDAKKRRFRWDADKKQWLKTIRECDYEKEEKAASFYIRRVT